MARKQSGILVLVILVTFLGGGAVLSATAPERQEGATQKEGAATAVTLVTNLPISKDNTLYEDAEGDVSNGAGDYFFAGSTGGGSIRRGLIAFDSSVVVTGSNIISATLTLHMSKSIAGDETVELRRVTQDWGEGSSDASAEEGRGTTATSGDATWRHTFYDTDMWTAPGGDFVGTSSATAVVGSTGFYTWSGAGIVADVQGWVNAPGDNFGWILLGNESTTTTAKRFDTHDHSSEARRPVLTVVYEVPAAVFLPLVTGE